MKSAFGVVHKGEVQQQWKNTFADPAKRKDYGKKVIGHGGLGAAAGALAGTLITRKPIGAGVGGSLGAGTGGMIGRTKFRNKNNIGGV